MTINKAQGQTLRICMARLYLPTHGQLYVAEIRVGAKHALRTVVKCGNLKVKDREGECCSQKAVVAVMHVNHDQTTLSINSFSGIMS